ncbi:recombinase RecT [Shewanella sp.]|uniref:recombinase RecT n=1 Tax=Shewanella sp. TaxID=50422 RepID=UPI003567306F
MNQLTIIQNLEQRLPVRYDEFNDVRTDDKISFAQEAGFALQLLGNDSYLDGIARKNPESLRNAIINVASIGVTLNPAEKKAYLVPRGGAVCLDVSYRGLADLAVDSGAAVWVDAKLVYANDEYQPAGMGELPYHKPANPFLPSGKGNLIGVYAAAKRPDGTYAVKEMDMDQINAIKGRSESGKKGNGPWKTDFEEMVLKTPMKSVVKRLQGTNKRIDNAIDLLNRQGEGIDFASEQKANPRDLNCDASAQAQINDYLQQLGMTFDQLPLQMVTQNAVSSPADLTQLEAGQLIYMLRSRVNKLGANQ